MKLLYLLLLLMIGKIVSFSIGNSFVSQTTRGLIVMRTRICDITGQRRNSKCMKVSNAGNRSHKVQGVNLQYRKIYWEEGNAYIRIRIANRTWRTIEKYGLHFTAKKYGIDLMKYVIPGASVPNDLPSVSTIKAASVKAGMPPSAIPTDRAWIEKMLKDIAFQRKQISAAVPPVITTGLLQDIEKYQVKLANAK